MGANDIQFFPSGGAGAGASGALYSRSVADGGTIANNTTPTILDTFNIPVSAFALGAAFNARAMGIYQSDATAQTITLELLLGGNAFSSKANTISANSVNGQWVIEGFFTIKANGAGGSFYKIPSYAWNTLQNSLTVSAVTPIATALDLSVPQACAMRFTWSALAAGATTTLRTFSIIATTGAGTVT